MSLIIQKGFLKDKTKSTEPSVVNFILSHSEYTELWLKIKNKDSDNRTFELMKKLMDDHSSILEEVILHSIIRIVWSDGFGKDITLDEDYGEKK
tara:strand:- start:332 stop:613 length:282 start_codon:yes stop_codon:yes gene_type:complete